MKGNLRCLICSIHNKVHSRSVVLIMLMVLMWFNPISSVEGIGIENSTIINNGYIKNFEANPKDVLKKPTFTTGNILWDHLIRDCLKKPSFTCLQKNMYSYLSDILTSHTVNATNNIQFSKNTVKYDEEEEEEEEEANSIYDNEINIDQNDMFEGSPIEEISSAVSNKMTKFLITHDMEIKMPQYMFDGAVFKISPRSFEGNGMIAKLEILPNIQKRTDVEMPRIFFKKIKKNIKKKLLLALVGIILIIKIIKIKLFWILPMIIGATAAKKLALKVLLFFFPALASIFKLCSYYHSTYHKTNYHHHTHSINHLHSLYPATESETVHSYPSTKGIAAPVPPHTSHDYYGPDWELSGPGLGSEFINDLQRVSSNEPFNPHYEDINEIKSWGLNHGGPSNESPNHSHATNPYMQRYTVSKPYGKTSITSSGSSGYGPIHRVSGAESANYPYAVKPKNNELKRLEQAQQKEILRYQNEQKLIAKQQQILKQQPFVHDSPVPHLVDPFYSPILDKLDKIFESMKIDTEACKEQIVCKMYKNPAKYSPYSNYVSAELSRDANELQRPTETNPDVIRFFKYIQAAREGQDQQDCVVLYNSCS